MKIYVIGDSISIQYGTYLESQLKGIMEYSRKGGIEEASVNFDHKTGANGGDSKHGKHGENANRKRRYPNSGKDRHPRKRPEIEQERLEPLIQLSELDPQKDTARLASSITHSSAEKHPSLQ